MAEELSWKSPAAVLSPTSFALVGASPDPHAFLTRINASLPRYGYQGPVYPVNPRREEVWGVPCYPSLDILHGKLDHVMVGVPAPGVLEVLEDAASAGARSATVFSSGFAESGSEQGIAWQSEIAVLAERRELRILGPNCSGFISAPQQIYAFGLDTGLPALEPGGLAVVSQSGGTLSQIMRLANNRCIGFSYLISSGNEADLQLPDYLKFLAEDPYTRVIAVFAEGIKDGPKFAAACRLALERDKPIVMIKIGRSVAAVEASITHTGALAGSDRVFDAFCRQAGVVRVEDPDALIEASEALLHGARPVGERVGVIAYSGGLRGMLLDQANELGICLPPLSEDGRTALEKVLPAGSYAGNPLDGNGRIRYYPEIYDRCLGVFLEESSFDLILLQDELPPQPNALREGNLLRAVEAALPSNRPLLVFSIDCDSWRGRQREFRRQLPIPVLQGVGRSFRALAGLLSYTRARRSLAMRDKGLPHDATRASQARAIMRSWGRTADEVQSMALLGLYGIPLPRQEVASTPSEAMEAACNLGFPVALKVVSPDIPHKARAGAVALNLSSEEEVAEAYVRVLENAAKFQPQSRIRGALAQEMLRPGVELIVGVKRDQQFGPVVMVGLGGSHVELMDDVSLRVAPIGRRAAGDMLIEIRGLPSSDGPALEGIDTEAVARTLLALSRLALDLQDQLESVEVNPLIAYPHGVVAADALAVLSPPNP